MEEQVRFVLEAAEAESMAKQLGVTTVANLLPSLVKSAQSLARPPISNYHVGVVGLGSSGRIFFGANIEFPGLPLNNSIHAEQFLITNLDLNAEPSISSFAVSAAPCGHCRQFLQELRSSRSIRIMITDNQHGREFEDLSTFLPHRFGPDNLLHKDVPLILERHDNKLSLISPNSNPSSLKLEALEAANRSHAPYSMCPSGVALMDSEGKVYRGSYMESAAYNPSLGPVQAAIVAYIVGGGAGYERIVAAALVEKEGVAVRQEGTARLIMSTVAPKCEVKVFHCQ
ncbi:Cytidine deaminase 1 [Linum perenne]